LRRLVESCTAIGERHDGTFEIITWTNVLEAPQADEQDDAELAAARAA
jgi:hypothetical protein